MLDTGVISESLLIKACSTKASQASSCIIANFLSKFFQIFPLQRLLVNLGESFGNRHKKKYNTLEK
jgi:hypothetical protein